MALDYRNRQMDVLKTAITSTSDFLQSFSSPTSLCQFYEHPSYHTKPVSSTARQTAVKLLSLECAFAWLQLNYPDLASHVVQLISEDQDEPLPLNWAVLLEDWDHTYWVVWIYIVWTLKLQDNEGFETRHAGK